MTSADCVAMAVYYEARGESERGQLAVAHVVLNRAKKYGISPCKVVKNRNTFPWYRHISYQNMKDPKSKASAIHIAARVKYSEDPTFGATHFHNVKVRPNWKGYRMTARIGDHKFYKKVKK
ncbi:hypothetical protein [Escherichia phage EP_H11]|nr:hypothetical protein [Escherichia phage EP_H11]